MYLKCKAADNWNSSTLAEKQMLGLRAFQQVLDGASFHVEC